MSRTRVRKRAVPRASTGRAGDARPPEAPAPTSRRRFLRLLAAGSAAALAAPLAAPAARGAAAPERAAPASVQAEIRKQKRQVTATLKAIRAFTLPVGSPQAGTFAPLGPGRRGSR
ncbi:MAG: hypothetical protein A2W00_02240 [Candidatus Eisenbacteria bacterium RBG_16_71_46]|nr:MAG: hypothetical protein A2W00_02240 [Candidatus Eisenbacteria bacterium RBG_16_71_46]